MSFLVYRAVSLLFTILELAIFVRAIISWLPIPQDSGLVNLLYRVTEPILAPIRRLIERSAFGRNMMFDVSPIVALLLIYLARNIVLGFIPYR